MPVSLRLAGAVIPFIRNTLQQAMAAAKRFGRRTATGQTQHGSRSTSSRDVTSEEGKGVHARIEQHASGRYPVLAMPETPGHGPMSMEYCASVPPRLRKRRRGQTPTKSAQGSISRGESCQAHPSGQWAAQGCAGGSNTQSAPARTGSMLTAEEYRAAMKDATTCDRQDATHDRQNRSKRITHPHCETRPTVLGANWSVHCAPNLAAQPQEQTRTHEHDETCLEESSLP